MIENILVAYLISKKTLKIIHDFVDISISLKHHKTIELV